MSQESIQQQFRDAGVVLQGHFLLTSGLHSPVYWEKFRILENPALTQYLCAMIAGHFGGQGIQVVAGPTTGGIILAYEVARQLGMHAIYAERVGEDRRAFRRGLAVNPGERVLVVDDVLTTGKSAREVISAVKELGGQVAGIGVLVDRSETLTDFGAPLFACLHAPTITYKADACPLCAQGTPLARPGGG